MYMTTKKRVMGLALAGALAVTAAGPMGVTAFAKSTGDVQVKYIAGALVPPGADGSYYVTIPADVMFSDVGDVSDMSVALMDADTTDGDLDPNLSVQVDVFSKNAYKLKNDTYAGQEAAYTLTYNGDVMNNAAKDAADNNLAHPNATQGDIVGVLTPNASNISGEAEMTQDVKVAKQGVVFSDTLTYYVSQLTPTL